MSIISSLFIIIYIQLTLSLKWDEVPEGMVATPHGIRPIQCVHEVKDNNHIIRPLTDGVLVEYPGLQTEEWFPELPECVENMKQLQAQRAERSLNLTNGGWEIYGGYNTKNAMGNFSAKYIVPNESPQNDGQILYYFLGMQDNGENNLTIIQPCIGYCPAAGGCGSAYGNYAGWSMSSWNCCPSGETHYGKGVKLEPGVTVDAYTYSTGNDAYVYESYQGQASVLNIKGDYRVFNWAAITGEFYDYKGCNDFNKEPFTFRNMKLTDLKNNVETPEWHVQNNIQNCGASLKVNGNTATLVGRS